MSPIHFQVHCYWLPLARRFGGRGVVAMLCGSVPLLQSFHQDKNLMQGRCQSMHVYIQKASLENQITANASVKQASLRTSGLQRVTTQVS